MSDQMMDWEPHELQMRTVKMPNQDEYLQHQMDEDVNTEYQRFVKTKNDRRLVRREETLTELTELICGEMKEQGVSRAELAKRMGKSKGAVSQMLNGERNLTVNSVSDMLFALDLSLVAFAKESTP